MIYRPEHENGVVQMPALIYGRVLMLGLGKGDLIPKILRFLSVHRLTVIDNDPEVIAAYRGSDERVRLIEADAHEYLKHNEGFFDFIVQDLPTGGSWLKTASQENTWVSV